MDPLAPMLPPVVRAPASAKLEALCVLTDEPAMLVWIVVPLLYRPVVKSDMNVIEGAEAEPSGTSKTPPIVRLALTTSLPIKLFPKLVPNILLL
jgi:hypothetical protein